MANPAGKTAYQLKNLIGLVKDLWQKDRKLIIEQTIIIGSLVIVTFFIFLPLLLKIHLMKSQAKNLQYQIEITRQKIKRTPELKQQLKVFTQQIESAQKRFLQIRDLDRLVGDVSKVAAKSGVLLIGSRPLNDKQQSLPSTYSNKYLSASYELTLEGSYHQLGKFLGDIEQSEKSLLIQDLGIRSSPVATATEKLQCVIQVDAFVQAPRGI